MITQQLLELPVVTQAQTIFCYVSFGREVGTLDFMHQMLARRKRLLIPRTNKSPDPSCGFLQITNMSELAVMEYLDVRPPHDIKTVELFVVPGIAWDCRGFRVGFGGGYFDKLLDHASPSINRVGLAFEKQIVDRIEEDAWDQPVDLIITEARSIYAEKR